VLALVLNRRIPKKPASAVDTGTVQPIESFGLVLPAASRLMTKEKIHRLDAQYLKLEY